MARITTDLYPNFLSATRALVTAALVFTRIATTRYLRWDRVPRTISCSPGAMCLIRVNRRRDAAAWDELLTTTR